MFVNRSHLPQLLEGEHYFSPDLHHREVEEIFRPSWHVIGNLSQLAADGGFLTRRLLGTPLIVHRQDDAVNAYLNVCPHRFCTLTDKPSGCFEGRIKCQYHGWEYDTQEGTTRHIPDAQRFRPLKRRELGLRQFRCETLGNLVFVCLSEDALPLREWLPPLFVELIERWFSPAHELTAVQNFAIKCDWKVVAENVLEAYHVACVHPTSFKAYPKPQHCKHEFFDGHDSYTHDFTNEPRYANPERWVSRLTQRPADYTWRHLLKYPNLILGGAGPFHYCQMLWPTAPGECESEVITYQWSGRPGTWRRPFSRFLLRRYGSKMAEQVQLEDVNIYPSIQSGIRSRDQPHSRGYISTREERIFEFQRYWLDALGLEAAPRGGLDPFEQTPPPQQDTMIQN